MRREPLVVARRQRGEQVILMRVGRCRRGGARCFVRPRGRRTSPSADWVFRWHAASVGHPSAVVCGVAHRARASIPRAVGGHLTETAGISVFGTAQTGLTLPANLRCMKDLEPPLQTWARLAIALGYFTGIMLIVGWSIPDRAATDRRANLAMRVPDKRVSARRQRPESDPCDRQDAEPGELLGMRCHRVGAHDRPARGVCA